MAEADGKTPPAEGGVDEIKNIKSEFARKTEAIQRQLEEQNRRSEAMLQAMIGIQQQKAASKQDISTTEDEIDVGIDPIDNPKKYAARVIAKAAESAAAAARSQVETQVNSVQRSQAEQQSTLLTLASDYPELNDINSDLYKQALQISNTMDATTRSSSVGLRAAVREAAANLGVLPMAKRKRESDLDDFTVDGSTNSGDRERKRNKKAADDELDANSIAFAGLLGQPVNDPKYIERLKATAKRKNWRSYK
jgi:hypothetical protein